MIKIGVSESVKIFRFVALAGTRHITYLRFQ